MKKSELKELFDKAEVEKVEDREAKTYRVYVEKLNREYFFEVKSAEEARKSAYELTVNESDGIRGFSLEDV